MNARRREPIEPCPNDTTTRREKKKTVAVMGRLMQQLSKAIDPANSESTRERLSRVVAELTDEERAIFLKAVYDNPGSRDRIEGHKKRD